MTPPAPAAERFTEHRLGNGLRVILHVDRAAPVVAVNVLYRVGSKNERPGMTGMAHLLEHVTFENGPGIGRGDYDRLCTAVGGENNAFTTSDITNYYVTLPANNLALGLWLESQRMSGFTAAEQTFLTQRNVIIEEKHQTVDDVPFADAVPIMRQISYDPAHPYHWETIGSMEDLAAMCLDDLRRFYEQFYVPANATLVVAGDFAEDEALDAAEAYFGRIPSGSLPSDVEISKISSLCNTGAHAAPQESAAPFAAVFLAWHAPPLHHPDLRALDLLAAVLAEGESSRLYRALEYEAEIASETDCFIDDGELGSMLYVYAVGQNERVTAERLREAILIEIDTIVRQGVTERELQKAKNIKLTEIVRGISSVGMRAERLAYFASVFNDPARAFSEIELYRSITAEDLRRVAGRVFGAEPNLVQYLSHFLPK